MSLNDRNGQQYGYNQPPVVNINAGGQQPYNYGYNYPYIPPVPTPQPQQNNNSPYYATYVENYTQAVNTLPTPPEKNSSFGIDGNNMKVYVKQPNGSVLCFAMVQEDAPKEPGQWTLDDIAKLLDENKKSMSEELDARFANFESSLSDKFVTRKDNYRNNNRGGNQNG